MIISTQINSQLRQFIRSNSYSGIFVLSDTNTYEHCLPLIRKLLDDYNCMSIVVNAGEATKNINSCMSVWSDLNEMGADRHSLLVNIGGGMITDLGGFIATTFKRGMEFINVPTSLLAMVDASAGGKNGINFGELKNQIGTIREPSELFVSPGFLHTLSYREYLSGYAEAIKHGLLQGHGLLENCNKFIKPGVFNEDFIGFIKDNIELKQRIVEIDPYEKHDRKALNLGHTIGHAFESLSHQKKRPILHGEAVAWGLVAELYISKKMLHFPETEFKSITNLVVENYPKLSFSNADMDQIFMYMQSDKKNYRNQIMFTLMNSPGSYVVDQQPDKKLVQESIQYIFSLCQ